MRRLTVFMEFYGWLKTEVHVKPLMRSETREALMQVKSQWSTALNHILLYFCQHLGVWSCHIFIARVCRKNVRFQTQISEQVLPFQKSQTEAPFFQVKAYIHSLSTYLHFIDTNRNSTQATERKTSWKASGWGREDVYCLFHLCSGHYNGTEMNWAQGRARKV